MCRTKKKRKEKNQTNIYKIDKQRFNRSSFVNLNKNLKISLLNGQKLNYKSFEIYFEKVRGRRNRRSRNNCAKSYSNLEKKKSGKKEKEEKRGGKESKIVSKIYRGSSIWGETNSDREGIDWTECQCQVWLILLDIGRLLFARSPIDGRVPHGAKPFLPGAI